MIVDFAQFKDVIDTIGGVDVNVPEPILSNKFDCPYDAGAVRDAGRAGASRRARSTWTASAR